MRGWGDRARGARGRSRAQGEGSTPTMTAAEWPPSKTRSSTARTTTRTSQNQLLGLKKSSSASACSSRRRGANRSAPSGEGTSGLPASCTPAGASFTPCGTSARRAPGDSRISGCISPSSERTRTTTCPTGATPSRSQNSAGFSQPPSPVSSELAPVVSTTRAVALVTHCPPSSERPPLHAKSQLSVPAGDPGDVYAANSGLALVHGAQPPAPSAGPHGRRYCPAGQGAVGHARQAWPAR